MRSSLSLNAQSIFILTVDNKFQFNPHTRDAMLAVAVQHDIEHTIPIIYSEHFIFFSHQIITIFLCLHRASIEFKMQCTQKSANGIRLNYAMPILNSTLINSKFVSLDAH